MRRCPRSHTGSTATARSPIRSARSHSPAASACAPACSSTRSAAFRRSARRRSAHSLKSSAPTPGSKPSRKCAVYATAGSASSELAAAAASSACASHGRPPAHRTFSRSIDSTPGESTRPSRPSAWVSECRARSSRFSPQSRAARRVRAWVATPSTLRKTSSAMSLRRSPVTMMPPAPYSTGCPKVWRNTCIIGWGILITDTQIIPLCTTRRNAESVQVHSM